MHFNMQFDRVEAAGVFITICSVGKGGSGATFISTACCQYEQQGNECCGADHFHAAKIKISGGEIAP
jgi:hypothetical protein